MLHKALKTIREVHRLQQGELAEKLGISRSHLSEIESGKKTVSVDLLNKFADAFDVPASTFLSFSEALQGSTERRMRNAQRLMQVLEWTLESEHGTSSKVGK